MVMTNEEIRQKLEPKQAVREELGGDYYYRCPWLSCDKIVRSEYEWCPYCGQKLCFDPDNYTMYKGYVYGRKNRR